LGKRRVRPKQVFRPKSTIVATSVSIANSINPPDVHFYDDEKAHCTSGVVDEQPSTGNGGAAPSQSSAVEIHTWWVHRICNGHQ
jgi:hypothetical protein